MLKKIKQKILQYKYQRAKNIYIVGCWAKWGILPAKYSGKINKNGDPLTIHYTDCNGMRDLYYITAWYNETTGITVAYFFNEKEAMSLVKKLNKEFKDYE